MQTFSNYNNLFSKVEMHLKANEKYEAAEVSFQIAELIFSGVEKAGYLKSHMRREVLVPQIAQSIINDTWKNILKARQ